jgi:GT2 family glycosyltransferase
MAEEQESGNGATATLPPPPDKKVAVLSGLVSIIVPCTGMLEYTKLCVPSVLRHSREPFELIFIDIGSLDGTVEYLAGIAAAARVRVEVVRTPTDLGIADAVKEAINRVRGEYLVLLNNDTIVCHDWLNQLTSLVTTLPAIGMVGPMSNYAAPPQLVETVPYRVGPMKASRFYGNLRSTEVLVNVDEVQTFAKEFRESHKGKWVPVDRLGGFCLLLKRVVLTKIGIELEPWTDLSLFDTDILSTKARQAGFTLACARDCFVHHFGTRTFAHGSPLENKAECSV